MKSAKKTTHRFPYFNRELSWLAFNRRVLEQAESQDYPLLERMKFLAFVSSNLDEFFEIRFSGLMQQVKSGVIERGPDGLGPKEQIRRIQSIAKRLVQDQYDCWQKQVVPQLEESNIKFCSYDQLTRNEKSWVASYFDEQISPVLTPLAIDPAHPFPKLTNKALYILASIDDPETRIIERLMAIIPVPRILPRIVRVGVPRRGNPEVYIFISDIIQRHMKQLFPGYRVRSAVPFRITRNSDLYFDEEEVENLLRKLEEELMNREKGAAVRLEIAKGADPVLLQELLDSIELQPENVTTIDGPINLSRLMSAYDLIDRPDLKFKPLVPHVHPDLETPERLFDQISQKDTYFISLTIAFSHSSTSYNVLPAIQRFLRLSKPFTGLQVTRRLLSHSWKLRETANKLRCLSRSRHASTKRTTFSGRVSSKMLAFTSCMDWSA